MSEKVAERLLNHCLSDWKRQAAKLQHENAGVAAEQIRQHIRWYGLLLDLNARAYFDYCDSKNLAQLWDSMAACERAEWIITQLRSSAHCTECDQDTLTYFDIVQGSTYGEVVAELANDLEQSYANGQVLADNPPDRIHPHFGATTQFSAATPPVPRSVLSKKSA